MKKVTIGICCALAATLTRMSLFAAEPITFESGENQTALLELFTSEGCSSCPPADAWMSKLKTSNDLWQKIVPVVWHVDYWDRLGWKDRFAQHDFTARQQRYANEWSSSSVYTPGFVLNGHEWTDRTNAARLPFGNLPAGKLHVQVNDQALVRFTPASSVSEAIQVQVALLGMNLDSNVARGENSGRKLHHDFVVLAFAKAPMQQTGAAYAATVPLPNKDISEKPAALVAWVSRRDRQAPLQATGGWLIPNESKP